MDIIATLGPSRLTSTRINSFIDEGVTIFRVNGAHTDAHMAASIVEEVRRFAGDRARIMVDLPTNKIRVMNISEPIVFGAGDTFVIHGFELNNPDLCQRVQTGDEVIVNDGRNRLRVTGVNGHSIEFQAEGAGQLGNNRGLIFTREIHAPDFPYFFQRDLELIETRAAFENLERLIEPEERILIDRSTPSRSTALRQRAKNVATRRASRHQRY